VAITGKGGETERQKRGCNNTVLRTEQYLITWHSQGPNHITPGERTQYTQYAHGVVVLVGIDDESAKPVQIRRGSMDYLIRWG
jgi:hypothetical protein